MAEGVGGPGCYHAAIDIKNKFYALKVSEDNDHVHGQVSLNGSRWGKGIARAPSAGGETLQRSIQGGDEGHQCHGLRCCRGDGWKPVASRKRKVRFCMSEGSHTVSECRHAKGRLPGDGDQVGEPKLSLLEEEEERLNNIQEEIPFEVILDSGAADHVTDNSDAPGYNIVPSEGSKAGKGFIAANGARIPNRGQMTLSLKTEQGRQINSTFQVCQTNRPLWSVGKICDSGCKVIFSKDGAEVVQTATGKAVCSFQRQGGLYVGNLKLSPQKSFQRPGQR